MRARSGALRGRWLLGILSAITLVAAGMATSASAAPVGYATTPLQGWATNGTVYAVRVVGDTVYAGGNFTQVRSPSGQTLNRARLAAFDLRTGAIRTDFSADTNGTVRAIEHSNGRLFVSGPFSSVRGVVRQRVAALDAATGAVITSWSANADTSSNIFALELRGELLYLGGSFTTIAGQPRNRLAAVSTVTGELDATFTPDVAGGEVHALAASPDGARVYAGGTFATVNGTSRPFLATLSTTGTLLPLVFERSDRARVFDLDLSPSGNQLFAALGGLENQALAWNTTTGARQWRQVANGDAQAVRYHAGNVYFSFHEAFGGDNSVRMLAADAMTGALVPTFRPTINTFYGVWAIDATPDGLVAGGEFTIVGGVQTRGIAILPFSNSDPVPPGPPTNLAVSASTATSVVLAWSPGTDNVGVGGYRVLRDGVEVGYPSGLSFTDTDLQPNTDYSYTVQTVDSGGRLSTPTAPLQTGTDLTLVSPRSTWRYRDDGSNQGSEWRTPGFDDSAWPQGPGELGYGDGDEATVVSYGPSATQKYITTYFRRQFTVSSASTVGDVTLRLQRDDGAAVYVNGTEVARSNLPGGTITATTQATATVDGAAERAYTAYPVDRSLLVTGTNTIAVEVHQRAANSSDISFDASIDSKRLLSPPSPSNLRTTSVTGSTVGLAWDPPAGAIAGYRVYRDGGLVGSPTMPSFEDSDLSSAHMYAYAVSTVDTAGVESPPSNPLVVTTLDVVPPGAPADLTTTSATGARVVLAWSEPIDDVGVTGYEVLRDGVVIGTTAATSFADTDVLPAHSYEYTVRAHDAAGNTSPPSAPLSVTTPEGGDVSPPTAPGNVRVLARSATSITLAWDPSDDDVGVEGYAVLRDGIDVGTVADTTLTDSPLAPASTFSYTVVARDGASNLSDPSEAVVAATHPNVETLFPRNSTWRFTEDGIERGTAWKEPGYDDSSWPAGPGQLGYFDGDEATVMYNGGTVNAEKYISHYVRRSFTVSDPQHVTALTLSMLRDDGVVVYLNGVEVLRNNMPTGTITSRTFANVAVSGAAENAYSDYAIPTSLLVAGNNVIAISVHNASRSGAADLGFDAGLEAQYS